MRARTMWTGGSKASQVLDGMCWRTDGESGRLILQGAIIGAAACAYSRRHRSSGPF